MKKLFVTLLAVLLLAGCAQVSPEQATVSATEPTTQTTEPVVEPTKPQDTITTEKYTLFWENGKCYFKSYIKSLADSSVDSQLNAYSYYAQYPRFTSIAEMKQRVKAGELTDSEINALTRYTEEDAIGTEICNLNELYEADYPGDLTLDYIELTGKCYSFAFKEITGSFHCYDKASYDYYFETYYQNPVGVRTFVSEEVIEDRNATVTYSLHNDGTTYKTVRYIIQADDGELYVAELYHIEPASENGTEEVLIMLDIYGCEYGQYFYGCFIDFEERPSLEWLSSFGLREYVETEVS